MSDEAVLVLEKRLAALEAAVADLQTRLQPPETSTNWLDRMMGSISDDETFVAAMEYGRQFRHFDRPVFASDE